MKIVLVGFMGSGKTTVGGLLASHLKLTCIEMDELIVKKSARRAASEIFEKDGEEHFRQLEREVAQSLRDATSAVISTGGGVVTSPKNMEALRANNGVIFYLQTSFEALSNRISGDNARPLFQDPPKARALYVAREEVYRKCADYTIVTDNLTPDEVCNEIVTRLHERA